MTSGFDTPSQPYPGRSQTSEEPVVVPEVLGYPSIEIPAMRPPFLTNREDVQAWLDKYCVCNGTVAIADNGEVSVDGYVVLNQLAERELTYFQVQFKEVYEFNCNKCEVLQSLEGAPQLVRGSFHCSFCRGLTSLKGAPQHVNADFFCSYTDISTLAGGPTYVGGNFYCCGCGYLVSLQGAPDVVGNDFECSRCNQLHHLIGAPTQIGGSFSCKECFVLESLTGAPRIVSGSFDCDSTAISTLEGCPTFVGNHFTCNRCALLKSIVEMPEYIGGHLQFKHLPRPEPELISRLIQNKTRIETSAKTKWIRIVNDYCDSGDILTAIGQYEAYLKVPFKFAAGPISSDVAPPKDFEL